MAETLGAARGGGKLTFSGRVLANWCQRQVGIEPLGVCSAISGRLVVVAGFSRRRRRGLLHSGEPGVKLLYTVQNG